MLHLKLVRAQEALNKKDSSQEYKPEIRTGDKYSTMREHVGLAIVAMLFLRYSEQNVTGNDHRKPLCIPACRL